MDLDQTILKKLNEVGIALSQERNIPLLLETILISAKELTHADGGTVYTVTFDKRLHFEISHSDSLDMHAGGSSQEQIPFPDLSLFKEDGAPNDTLMVAYAVNHKKTINIRDAYHEQGFDFSGTRKFDVTTGYRTRAVLTIPIKNHEDEVIAVLQLINPKGASFFTPQDEELAESLASQAGVALTNQLLINNLRKLFESLIHAIAAAVDEKSPSTGNHSKRVPLVSSLLAQAVNKTTEGPFKDLHFSEKELYELEIAAFLHDCGKITTPDYVVEKRHKLETLFDRIELVKTRYCALEERKKRQLFEKKIAWFESHCPKDYAEAQDTFSLWDKQLHQTTQEMMEELNFLRRCNDGKEQMTKEALDLLHTIAQKSYWDGEPLLTVNELENLSIAKGNLTNKEREIIQHHVVMTYRMLSQLNFPKELARVPEIASSHHERIDGKGYPRGLRGEQMSVQARILAIADIFEALSAPDRPYKEALPLSKVFAIMQDLVNEGHLDPDLYSIFTATKAYLPYVRRYLSPEQIDTE